MESLAYPRIVNILLFLAPTMNNAQENVHKNWFEGHKNDCQKIVHNSSIEYMYPFSQCPLEWLESIVYPWIANDLLLLAPLGNDHYIT